MTMLILILLILVLFCFVIGHKRTIRELRVDVDYFEHSRDNWKRQAEETRSRRQDLAKQLETSKDLIQAERRVSDKIFAELQDHYVKQSRALKCEVKMLRAQRDRLLSVVESHTNVMPDYAQARFVSEYVVNFCEAVGLTTTAVKVRDLWKMLTKTNL